MNPVKNHIMLEFIIWLSQKHPEINILRDMDEDKLKGIIREFDREHYPNFKTNETALMRWKISINGLKVQEDWFKDYYKESYEILDKHNIHEQITATAYFESTDPLLLRVFICKYM